MKYAISLLMILTAISAQAQTPVAYDARPEVQAFIAEMSARHGFDAAALQTLFGNARFQQSIIKAMTPLPQGQRSWQTYRGNFLNERRIEGGLGFVREHADELERAEKRFGVPRHIVAAIIGIETEFGRNMGGYRILDVLSTLSFDYPRRADYFRSELEEYLLLNRELNGDATELKSSYAGAIGIPQFMPSSVRRYAVDFDADGRRDIRNSPADAIGSVANFLAQHGWIADAPIAVRATTEGEAFRALIDGGVMPNRRAEELRAAGVKFDSNIPDDTLCVLIELDSRDAPSEYLVGFHNFYVLTRYNRSSFYASAVLALADALKQ